MDIGRNLNQVLLCRVVSVQYQRRRGGNEANISHSQCELVALFVATNETVAWYTLQRFRATCHTFSNIPKALLPRDSAF